MQARLFATDASPHQNPRDLVRLALVPGVGPGKVRALLARFSTATAALRAPQRALAAVPGIGPKTARAIRAFDDAGAVDEQFRRADAVGARLLGSADEGFPAALAQIYDPPAFLWMRGALAPADRLAIAIVGTRRATEYGRRVAHELAGNLARRGVTIVSGLAYGIDAAAHRGALDAGGRTLAVLGSGVDRIYPSRHARLAEQIIQRGAVLSEYAMGAAPDAVNFPRRNRIVSGLAQGTVVVEAFETGGALITARLAIEQNREVFAVPSPVHSAAGAGANALIRDGLAKLVASADDVLAEVGPIEGPAAPSWQGEASEPEPAELNAVERQLYEALTSEPVQLDRLCLKTGLDPSTALVYLLSLEFKGLVGQMAGRQFFRLRR